MRIRIHADPDPCGSRSGSNPRYLSLFGNCKQNHLKFNHNEEAINYLPFSISSFSPTVHKVQNSQRNYIICSFIFSWIRIRNINSGSGKSSGSMRIRIHNTGKNINFLNQNLLSLIILNLKNLIVRMNYHFFM